MQIIPTGKFKLIGLMMAALAIVLAGLGPATAGRAQEGGPILIQSPVSPVFLPLIQRGYPPRQELPMAYLAYISHDLSGLAEYTSTPSTASINSNGRSGNCLQLTLSAGYANYSWGYPNPGGYGSRQNYRFFINPDNIVFDGTNRVTLFLISPLAIYVYVKYNGGILFDVIGTVPSFDESNLDPGTPQYGSFHNVEVTIRNETSPGALNGGVEIRLNGSLVANITVSGAGEASDLVTSWSSMYQFSVYTSGASGGYSLIDEIAVTNDATNIGATVLTVANHGVAWPDFGIYRTGLAAGSLNRPVRPVNLRGAN